VAKQKRPRVRWTAPRYRVRLREGPPEVRQVQATMNPGMIWPRTAIWNATAVLRGSLDSFIHP
jgi:hypothetical protein